MDPAAIAALAEQLITLGITIYKQIEADKTVTQTPLATILAAADANFDQIAANATAEIQAAS